MAPKRVRVMPQAERDVDGETVYLASEADAETGLRFFDSVQETFRALLEMPNMGRVRTPDNPRLADVRQWPVSGFRNHLIFYRPTEDGIDVLRVLHGARDIDGLFEADT